MFELNQTYVPLMALLSGLSRVPSGAIVVLGPVVTVVSTALLVHLSLAFATRAPSMKKCTASRNTDAPAERGSPGPGAPRVCDVVVVHVTGAAAIPEERPTGFGPGLQALPSTVRASWGRAPKCASPVAEMVT